MSAGGWLQRLEVLSARFSHLGIAAYLGSMSRAEQWAAYRFLCRLNGEIP